MGFSLTVEGFLEEQEVTVSDMKRTRVSTVGVCSSKRALSWDRQEGGQSGVVVPSATGQSDLNTNGLGSNLLRNLDIRVPGEFLVLFVCSNVNIFFSIFHISVSGCALFRNFDA